MVAVSLAFPDRDDIPTLSPEFFGDIFVTSDVGHQLLSPETRPCLGNRCFGAARMLMPKTTMDKDYRFVFGEHDIRFPEQVIPA